MKKNAFLLSLAILLAGCSDEIVDSKDYQVNLEVPTISKPYYVSYEDALTKSLCFVKGELNSRSSVEPSVRNHFVLRENKNRTRSVNDTIDVAFHVINFENNGGFAIVSADSRTTPIYAYSDEGNLDEDSFSRNRILQFYLASAVEYYKDEISAYKVAPDAPLRPIPLPLDSIPRYLVPVVVDGQTYYLGGNTYTRRSSCELPTSWDRFSPYNSQFPLLNPGQSSELCTPSPGTVAFGQIAAYFQHPIGYGNTTFDWTSINAQSGFPYNATPCYNSDCVSSLLYTIMNDMGIGMGVQMDDDLGKIRNTIRHFGYNASSRENFNSTNVRNSIDSSHPVIAYGEIYTHDGFTSHNKFAWVIDAYKQDENVSIYYYSTPPYNEAFRYTTYGSVYYHCNWGENGSGNGYFLDTFSRSAYELHSVKTICNIFPE